MLAALVVLVGLVPFTHPRLTRKAEREMTDLLRCPVEAGSVVVTLLRGITITDLRVTHLHHDGRRITLKADDLRIGYRPMRVLALREGLRPRLKRLAATLLSRVPSNPADGLQALLDGVDSEILAAVRTTALRNATFAVTGPDRAGTTGEGLDLKLTFGRAVPLSARGRLRGAGLSVNGWGIEKPRLLFSATPSEIGIRRFDGQMYEGAIEAAAEIDLTKKALRSGKVDIEGIDLERLYETKPDKVGRIAGTADLAIELAPSALHPDSLRGAGSIESRDVRLDSIPLLNTIVIASAFPFLREVRFERLGGPIVLTPEGVYCDSLAGQGEPLDIRLTGWVRFEEGFDFDVLGTFGPAYADSVQSVVWHAMLPAPGDGRTFLCRVSGTFDYPLVSIDRSVRRRAVRGMLKSLGRNLRGAFGRGGGDDE